MSKETIRLCVSDPTYGHDFDSEEAEEQASAEFKSVIEKEFGLRSERTSVGFGAAASAYLFTLDWHVICSTGGALAVLFGGKKVSDSVRGYLDAYDTLHKRFFHRDPVLDRTGAFCVALQRLTEELGHLPTSIKMIAYKRVSPMDAFEGHADPGQFTGIEPPEDRLKDWIHVFRIDVAEGVYRIFVERSKATSLFLETEPNGKKSAQKRVSSKK